MEVAPGASAVANAFACPNPGCDGTAEMQNQFPGAEQPIRGALNSAPAAMAFEAFQRQALRLLIDARLTRQQARRFQRLIQKSDDPDWIVERTQAIDSDLHRAAKLAKEEKDPYRALKAIAAVTTFLVAAGTGVLIFDEIWDKYRNSDLFESHSSQQSDSFHDSPDRKRNDETIDNRFGSGDISKPINDGVDI